MSFTIPNISIPQPQPMSLDQLVSGFQQGREDHRGRVGDRALDAYIGTLYGGGAPAAQPMSLAGLQSAFAPQAAPAAAAPVAAPNAPAGSANARVSDAHAAVAPAPSSGSIFGQFINTVRQGGLTNPYGLAAVAATGKHESGYSPQNAFGEWSDPSESGGSGQSGGIMSWRADRLQNLRQFAAQNGDDPARPSPVTQAKFLLAEDPSLIQSLQAAQSPEEAQQLMNRAWRFAGYDRAGGEAGARVATARGYAPQFASGGGMPAVGPVAGDGRFTTADMGGGARPQAQPASMGMPAPQGGGNRLPPREILQQMLRGSPETRQLAISLLKDAQGGGAATWQTMTLADGTIVQQNSQTGQLDIIREPSGGDPFTLSPGEMRYDAGGNLVASGGEKPADLPAGVEEYNFYAEQERAAGREPLGWMDYQRATSSGMSLTTNPDGSVSLTQGVGAIGGKIPSGFQPDPNKPGALMPIPGGPGEQISGELAARLGLADQFVTNVVPGLREQLAAGEATGLFDRAMAGNNQSSEQAAVYRAMELGTEALQRMMTGAGMPESEAANYARRFLPTYTDDGASAVDKLDQLVAALNGAREMALRGRGGTPATAAPPADNDPLGIR